MNKPLTSLQLPNLIKYSKLNRFQNTRILKLRLTSIGQDKIFSYNYRRRVKQITIGISIFKISQVW